MIIQKKNAGNVLRTSDKIAQHAMRMDAKSAEEATSITIMLTIIILLQDPRRMRKEVLNASLIIAQSANAEILS